MFDIGKMMAGFSPRLGLQTLCKLMPDRVGHEVDKFEMRFFASDKRIDFLIYLPERYNNDNLPLEVSRKYLNPSRSHLWKFDGAEKICNIVMKLIEPKLPRGYSLNYCIIEFDQDIDETPCFAYCTKDGEKIKHSIKL